MRVRGQYVLPRVLSTLGNVAIALVATSGSRTSAAAYKTLRTFNDLQKISDQQLRQSVRYALGRKFIKVTHREGRNYLELTDKGRRLTGRAAVQNLQPRPQKVWDRKWRIVMFDIPEVKKTKRDGFAANLKRLGFIQIQKSVFVFPYPCFEEIEILMDFHTVEAHVTCILADSVQPERQLQKRFKLS